MSANAGRIVINLEAGTAQFILDMNRANEAVNRVRVSADATREKMDEAGEAMGHTVSEVQAVSASLRDMEGKFGTNIRAVERFLTLIPGLGKALLAIFPIAGGLAFGAMLVETVNKVRDYFKEIEEAPRKITQEFDKSVASMMTANAELAVTEDKLRNQIAVLEHKPVNGLKLGLDESTASALKLAQALAADAEAAEAVFEKHNVGDVEKYFKGIAGTQDLKEHWEKYQADLADMRAKAAMEMMKTTDPMRRNIISQNLLGGEMDRTMEEQKFFSQQKDSSDLHQNRRYFYWDDQLKQHFVANRSDTNYPTHETPGWVPDDQRRSIINGAMVSLGSTEESVSRGVDIQRLTQQKDVLEARTKAEDTYKPVLEQIERAKTKLQELKDTALGISIADPLVGALSKATSEAEAVLKQDRMNHINVKPADAATLIRTTQLAGVQEAANQFNTKFAEGLKRMKDDSQTLSIEIAKMEEDERRRLETINLEADAYDRMARDAKLGDDQKFENQLQEKLARLRGNSEEQAATERLDRTQRNSQIQQEIANIERQTKAVEALGNAVGFDAQREAELQNIRNSGKPKAVIDAEIAAQLAKNSAQDIADGRDQPLSDGMKRFWTQMSDNAHYAARDMQNVMQTAFNGIGDQLGAMLSGQKASWAGFFQSLASSFAKAGLNQIFGFLGRAMSGGSGDDSGGGISGILGALFMGFRADGGGVSAGSAYVVGERGPELFMPGSSGSILPNSAFAGGGGQVSYFIDARGTDPVVTERNTRRALVATHQSAVQNGILGTAEMQRRRPR